MVIDKPAGISSHDCVNRLRECYGLRRVGHGGTLDPAVTGVLPIALGPATRLLPYLPGEKTYRGVIQLGITTFSDDMQGDIINQTSWPHLDLISIENALNIFTGDIHQRPPQISAVHIKGERAHVRARRGETLDIIPKKITINYIKLLHWDVLTGKLGIEVNCSAGTYMRSLARDLGEVIGCGGCLDSLRRTKALGFLEKQATPLPKRQDKPPEPLSPLVVMDHLPQHHLSKSEEIKWHHGRSVIIKPGKSMNVIVCNSDGTMAGMGLRKETDLLQPKVVFN